MDVNFSLANLPVVVRDFLQQVPGPTVVALHGSMGAGKTTFVRELCAALDVLDVVNSPTFSLIQEYRTQNGATIYHLDLYRLSGSEEAWHAGVEEVLSSGSWCFVEWPERADDLLPADAIHVELTVLDETHRRLHIIEG